MTETASQTKTSISSYAEKIKQPKLPKNDNEEAVAILKETAEIKFETEYDKLRDSALESWYDIKEYLDSRGSTLLNKCRFSDLMKFCESVLEIPKNMVTNENNMNLISDQNDEYYEDPAY